MQLASNRLNFSAGPGALPEPVLTQAQQAVQALPETGLSVLGMSHRSEWFEALLQEAEHNLRVLLDIPANYQVLFLQGGSSLQFSMIPMNFAQQAERRPAYLKTGYWSGRAINEARSVTDLDVVWDGESSGYCRMPDWAHLPMAATRPYVHVVSNETVEGLQWPSQAVLPAGVPVIADMSSDLLSRPIDVSAYAMIYAHAQKNLGPAGVTVCVLDERLLERIPKGLPPMLDYRTHVAHRSNFNTPPVFGIYVLTLVTRWLRDVIGGVAAMAQINQRKAALVYECIDAYPTVMHGMVEPRFRSSMNACFRFLREPMNQAFLDASLARGFTGLGGHRSRGGVRASLYNAVSLEAVGELSTFLHAFAQAGA